MNEKEVAVDVAHAALNIPPERSVDAVEIRTEAVVAALRAALDKVYNEDGDQQIRRLTNDYSAWSGEADLSRPSSLQKSK